MAINPIESLKEGKVNFFFRLPFCDKNHLLHIIRKRKDKCEIAKGFIKELRDEYPEFCFLTICDEPELENEAMYILDKYYGFQNIDDDVLEDMLNRTKYAKKVLYDHFDYYMNKNDNYANRIIKWVLNNYDTNKELALKMSRAKNLHHRYLFMMELIKEHKELINVLYDDITKYFTSVTYLEGEQLTLLPSLMDEKEVSQIAVALYDEGYIEEFNKIKSYILSTYKDNTLASLLLDDKAKNRREEFIKDADTLFETSNNFRINIYLNYRRYVTKQLTDVFNERVKIFYSDRFSFNRLSRIYSNGLGLMLEECVDKYLSLSSNTDCRYLGSGTTCDCFKVGDFAFKLVKVKWSYEDVICPNLYLFAKNFEERFIRDDRGVVKAGLEVQQYLSRSAKNIDKKYFECYYAALRKAGYRLTDTLVNGQCGENAMLLNTYLDADTDNPEELPDWFKEVPLVLIDRDRVYRTDSNGIKQLSSKY